jgi:hypothetical protein
LDPSIKFINGKGFNQVIVGTRLQTKYTIRHALAGGQNQDRRQSIAQPQRRQPTQSITVGQTQIQHNELITTKVSGALERNLRLGQVPT